MALVTVADFLDRYDARLAKQRLLDRGQDAEDIDLANPATDAGRRLATAIDDAEALLIAAAAVGTRYRVRDFQALFADQPASHSANTFRRVVSDLALGVLLKRRGLPSQDFDQLAPAYAEAVAFLQLIRSGERVFPDIPGVPEAGLPETSSNVPQPGGPNGLWSQETRLFGDLTSRDC